MEPWIWLIGLAVVVVVATLLLPKTRSTRIEGSVGVTPDEIFALVSDLSRARAWYPGLVAAERVAGKDGPARRQRLIYEHRGKKVDSLQQVITWVPGNQYGWKQIESRVGAKIKNDLSDSRMVLTLHPEDGSTRVEIVSEWTAGTLPARWKTNLTQRRVVEARSEAILENLRRILGDSTGKDSGK